MKCSDCDRTFKGKQALSLHRTLKHANGKANGKDAVAVRDSTRDVRWLGWIIVLPEDPAGLIRCEWVDERTHERKRTEPMERTAAIEWWDKAAGNKIGLLDTELGWRVYVRKE